MDRVYESGAAVGVTPAPASPSTGFPTKGDPGVPTPATQPGEHWFYMITESLRQTIVDAGLTPDHLDLTLLSKAVKAAGVSAGSIVAWPTSTPPAGWLECDGSAISRTTYAGLFAIIATLFGIGDGSTTFNIPDLRGEFIRGYNNASGNDPDAATRTDRGDGTAGDVVGSKQLSQFEAHVHNNITQSDNGAFGGGGSDTLDNGAGGVQDNPVTATGGNETRPRNVQMMICIKY